MKRLQTVCSTQLTIVFESIHRELKEKEMDNFNKDDDCVMMTMQHIYLGLTNMYCYWSITHTHAYICTLWNDYKRIHFTRIWNQNEPKQIEPHILLTQNVKHIIIENIMSNVDKFTHSHVCSACMHICLYLYAVSISQCVWVCDDDDIITALIAATHSMMIGAEQRTKARAKHIP